MGSKLALITIFGGDDEGGGGAHRGTTCQAGARIPGSRPSAADWPTLPLPTPPPPVTPSNTPPEPPPSDVVISLPIFLPDSGTPSRVTIRDDVRP
jgi:hypothetical protein